MQVILFNAMHASSSITTHKTLKTIKWVWAGNVACAPCFGRVKAGVAEKGEAVLLVAQGDLQYRLSVLFKFSSAFNICCCCCLPLAIAHNFCHAAFSCYDVLGNAVRLSPFGK